MENIFWKITDFLENIIAKTNRMFIFSFSFSKIGINSIFYIYFIKEMNIAYSFVRNTKREWEMK